MLILLNKHKNMENIFRTKLSNSSYKLNDTGKESEKYCEIDVGTIGVGKREEWQYRCRAHVYLRTCSYESVYDGSYKWGV